MRPSPPVFVGCLLLQPTMSFVAGVVGVSRKRKLTCIGSPPSFLIPEEASLDDDDEPDLHAVYRTVAQNDPQWFQEYIVDTLGSDQLDQEILQLLETSLRQPNQQEPISDHFQDHSPAIENQQHRESTIVHANEDDGTSTLDSNESPEIMEEPGAADILVEQVDDLDQDESILPSSEEMTSKVREVLDGTENLTCTTDLTLEDTDPAADNDVVPVDEPVFERIPTASDPPLPTALQLETSSQDITMVEPIDLDEESVSPTVPLEIAPLPSASVRNVPNTSLTEEEVAGPDSMVNQTVDSENETRVLVLDTDEQTLQVPLFELLSLGYTETELLRLQPTALQLIVEDQVKRPRSGIPQRWKIQDQHVPTAFVRLASNVGSTTSRSSATIDSAKPASDDPVSLGEMPATARSRQGRGESARSEQEQVKEGEKHFDEQKSPPTRKRRSRRRGTQERNERPVYSGRPQGRRDDSIVLNDPPSPRAFWPSLDTFRSLLRDEASFRLRILGSDFSDTLRDEADWRLDLYRSWLWTLNDGIGEPFVQSRSERARRKGSKQRQKQQR